MKRTIRLLLTLAIGFAAAMLIMAVTIYFGYVQAYRTDAALLTVKILCLPIYQLTRSGENYIGEPQGICMGIFCGVCMAAAVLAERLLRKNHSR